MWQDLSGQLLTAHEHQLPQSNQSTQQNTQMTVNDGVAWQNHLEQIATTQADGEERIGSQCPAYSGNALQHEQVNYDAYRYWSYTGSERPAATKFRSRPIARQRLSQVALQLYPLNRTLRVRIHEGFLITACL